MMCAAVTPRPLYCPTEHLRRDVRLARDVCAGRFAHAGRTVEMPQPRWLAIDEHPDREWWIEWSKFYFGLDLAFAFATTGEQIFARTWQQLVESWIAEVPIGFGPTDATGRRLQNWIYAWTLFARSSAFTEFGGGFESTLLRNIVEQASYLRDHLTRERNHRTIELYALFVVALALPDVDPDGRLLRFAWHELHANLAADFRRDGVHREASTHYHMVALRSFIAARENARRYAVPVPRGYDAALGRAVAFARACRRADGSIPALSDSDGGDYTEMLAVADGLLPPGCADRGAAFPAAGYFVQRGTPARGGIDDERHLIFDCGPLGDGGHGHYDLLSVDAWAGGPLVVDPGRFTYAEASSWRHWFKGTRAHNTVCVDGRDQTSYRPGKPRTEPAWGRAFPRVIGRGVDVIGGEARSVEYDAIHRRHVIFVANEYWIVLDELDAPTPHDYDLRYHLPADAWERTTIVDRSVVAPAADLVFAAGGDIALESGWVSPAYGIKFEAPVVSCSTRGERHATFASAIVPAGRASSGRSERRLTITERPASVWLTLDGASGDARCVDRIVCTRAGHRITGADWWRTTREDRP